MRANMKFYPRKSRAELKAKSQRLFRNRLRFEALEDRSLLAVDFQLLKDIMTDPSPLGSEPTNILQVGGTTFFTATSATQGIELWKTNGTAAGTVLVKDIVAGDGSSYPSDLTNVNGTLFFKAVGQIWKSDGTTNGTVQVTNFNTGFFGGTSVSRFHNFNGTLTFVASNDEHGEELWKSNGTAAGTMLLKDIRPGTGSSRPRALTTIGGTLFFTANDGTSGYELWKSNGTSTGTVIVKDIQTGSSSSSPSYFSNVNGTLFFTANDGTNGRELWRSNGISSGTVLVKDIRPGTSDSNASQP
jgi:ELWxxDGT repeat protein